MCPKNKTQHTDQGFASTVLYICQHSRKLLSAKRQLGQCYVSARGTESELKETISPFPFRLKIAAAFLLRFPLRQ